MVDPNLNYYEKVSLNFVHEISAGVTTVAGLAGSFPGTVLRQPAVAIGGAALLGGFVASIADSITEALKQYYYSN